MKNQNSAEQALVASKIAYVAACVLLIGPALFFNNLIFGAYTYFKTGEFKNIQNTSDFIISLVFLFCSFFLFSWSKSMARKAKVERFFFGNQFIYILIFGFAALVFYTIFKGG
jgi:hypothetical protein